MRCRNVRDCGIACVCDGRAKLRLCCLPIGTNRCRICVWGNTDVRKIFHAWLFVHEANERYRWDRHKEILSETFVSSTNKIKFARPDHYKNISGSRQHTVQRVEQAPPL